MRITTILLLSVLIFFCAVHLFSSTLMKERSSYYSDLHCIEINAASQQFKLNSGHRDYTASFHLAVKVLEVQSYEMVLSCREIKPQVFIFHKT